MNLSDSSQQQKPASRNVFRTDESLGISRLRFYLLRFFYIVIIVLLGIQVWTVILTNKEPWEPLHGVAFSF
ncbi:MAG: hypothetical protein JWN76_2604 [Chitinophagaceae bacterium]|nr:hypothetical protein [Chitinophagaceae bacterium]